MSILKELRELTRINSPKDLTGELVNRILESIYSESRAAAKSGSNEILFSLTSQEFRSLPKDQKHIAVVAVQERLKAEGFYAKGYVAVNGSLWDEEKDDKWSIYVSWGDNP
jgi:hypothetical protein